jgi:hypothetical protein
MGTCNQCGKFGKFGHNKGGCWELDANKDKRPNGYRAHGEHANMSLDNDDDDDDDGI